MIQVFNFTEIPVTIKKGTRIAQGLFVRVDCLEFEEVDEIRKESRGGFWSTDVKVDVKFVEKVG